MIVYTCRKKFKLVKEKKKKKEKHRWEGTNARVGEKEIERTVKKRVSEKQREKEKKKLKRECVCCKFTLCLIAVRYIKKKKT